MIKKFFIPHAENDYKPHIFREFSVAVMLLAVLVIFAASFVIPQFINKNTLTADIYQSVIVSLTNQARATNNLSILTPNSLLSQAAQAKANDMAARGYFAHVSPD